MDIRALVAPLRADAVSGAAVIARRAARLVRRAARETPAADVRALRSALSRLAVALLEAQPAMAPLVALARDVLIAVEGVDEIEEARGAAAAAALAFTATLERAGQAVAGAAVPLIPEGGRVLTLSSSSTVRWALLAAARERALRVTCLESRPLREGRRLARALEEAGIPVRFAVDAAVASLVDESDIVLVGADSVGDRGVVNKIGTRAAALAAGAARVPVYVLADRTKLLPPGFPQPLGGTGPAHEVWRAPRGVEIWNHYFEATPVELASGLVTEEGVLDPAAVAAQRAALAVPPRLREWSRSRRTAWTAG
ncbi:MAG: translation initiation factor eIF-2B [Gemmatimonadetes bacterium]|nr:translation initiation factor eIF-2B [Gemmatimonadota bacterium]